MWYHKAIHEVGPTILTLVWDWISTDLLCAVCPIISFSAHCTTIKGLHCSPRRYVQAMIYKISFMWSFGFEDIFSFHSKVLMKRVSTFCNDLVTPTIAFAVDLFVMNPIHGPLMIGSMDRIGGPPLASIPQLVPNEDTILSLFLFAQVLWHSLHRQCLPFICVKSRN